MEEWYVSLSSFERVYWIVAMAASVVFLILIALTFIGGDVDDFGDVDAEIDGDTGIDFQFLTLKNLMGFFTIFGWSGIAAMAEGMSHNITMIISVISGLAMMTAMATLFYYLSKLTHSGTLKIKNALGNIGEVYLTVGANRSSIGKVQIKVQGSLREMDALTDENEDLKQSVVIEVTEVTTNGILIIKKS